MDSFTEIHPAESDVADIHVSAHNDTAQFFEYSKAANPIRPSLTPRVPFHFFPPSLYADGPSRVVPLDLSEGLKCPAPATGPDLCANFVRIVAEDTIALDVNATSMVFYVLRGAGIAEIGSDRLEWSTGDFFTAPGGAPMSLHASADTALYYVNDAPLLTYLGAKVDHPRFSPVLYKADRANEELKKVASDAQAANRSRVSVLLANSEFPLTRTVTHVLWAMYGMISPNTEQKPHRHQSIALDLIVDCDPGCYSLLGTELDADGKIANAVRVDWASGCAFVTPPGYWHAHFNSSGREARLIPIQDAGLQTYLRTLDIRFT